MAVPARHVSLGLQTPWVTTVSPQKMSQMMMYNTTLGLEVNTHCVLLTCKAQPENHRFHLLAHTGKALENQHCSINKGKFTLLVLGYWMLLWLMCLIFKTQFGVKV